MDTELHQNRSISINKLISVVEWGETDGLTCHSLILLETTKPVNSNRLEVIAVFGLNINQKPTKDVTTDFILWS
jgi:hypothetical protein